MLRHFIYVIAITQSLSNTVRLFIHRAARTLTKILQGQDYDSNVPPHHSDDGKTQKLVQNPLFLVLSTAGCLNKVFVHTLIKKLSTFASAKLR